MTKTTTIIAMIAGFTLGTAVTTRAQTPSTTNRNIFVTFSIGGQFQTRTISTNATINVFGEDGVVTANQTVGSGIVVDVSGGVPLWRKILVGVGVSTFNGKGDAAALAAVPDRLVFGKFNTVPLTASDLKQSDIAFNIQALWTRPLTDQIDLVLSFGASIIRVKQDVVSVTVDLITGAASAATETQSKTTAKAGNVGVDFRYKLTDRYSAGVFVRYLGGEVDLPAAPKMKVGGVQAGGGIRFRF
jgi:hypothetical protein